MEGPTMGECVTRFQNAVFRGLDAFARWQKHPTCNVQRYQSELNIFIRECAAIRGNLDFKEYQERLKHFEESVNDIFRMSPDPKVVCREDHAKGLGRDIVLAYMRIAKCQSVMRASRNDPEKVYFRFPGKHETKSNNDIDRHDPALVAAVTMNPETLGRKYEIIY